VAASLNGTLAIRQDGTLWAWGQNIGQLGTSSTAAALRTPVQVGTGTDWQSVSLGFFFGVGVRTNGTLWAWGSGYSATPSQVGTATTWASVAAGSYHTAAVRTDGTLWTWGGESVRHTWQRHAHRPKRAAASRYSHYLATSERGVVSYRGHPHRRHPLGLGQ
jgi:alpha-tubulin suppressor-like RCC1 family protein